MSRQRLKSAMETAQMEKQQVSIQSKKLSERIQSQMSMLVAHKTQSQQRIVELSNELQQTKDRASKIQKELRSVIASREGYAVAIKSNNKELEDLKQKFEILNEQVKQAVEQADEFKEQLAVTILARDHLQQQQQDTVSQIEQIEAHIETAEGCKKQLEVELTDTRQQLEAKCAEVAKLQALLTECESNADKLTKDLKVCTADFQSSQRELQQVRKQRTQLEEQVAESSADVATLKASLGARDEQLQALVTKLTGSETEWQQEREMLETEITSLTEHIAKLDAATLVLQTELKQTHTLREETKAEVIAITADNVTLKAKIETLEAHTTTMESEHTTLKLENEELQASIAEARENLDVVDGSVEGLRVKLKKTERAHQTAVEKLDRRITRTCAEKLELEATISKLELERDEAELYRKEQEASLGSAATASVAAEERCHRLEAGLTECQGQLQSLTKSHEGICGDYKQLLAEFDSLKARANGMETELESALDAGSAAKAASETETKELKQSNITLEKQVSQLQEKLQEAETELVSKAQNLCDESAQRQHLADAVAQKQSKITSLEKQCATLTEALNSKPPAASTPKNSPYSKPAAARSPDTTMKPPRSIKQRNPSTTADHKPKSARMRTPTSTAPRASQSSTLKAPKERLSLSSRKTAKAHRVSMPTPRTGAFGRKTHKKPSSEHAGMAKNKRFSEFDFREEDFAQPAKPSGLGLFFASDQSSP